MTDGFLPEMSGEKGASYRIVFPETPPRAIMQIVHGFGGGIGSFVENGFCDFFTQQGFIVCGTDFPGYGVSDDSDNKPLARKFGRLCEDAMGLIALLRQKYRFLPCLTVGYGAGSVFLRSWMTAPEFVSDGVALIGTVSPYEGFFLPSLVAKAGRAANRNTFLRNILCAKYNAAFRTNEKEWYSWLTSDRELSPQYPQDSVCGTPPRNDIWRAFFAAARNVSAEEWADSVPIRLPVLLMSGEEDPVGGMGEGIREIKKDLFEAGVDDLSMILYSGCRHDLLRDTCREKMKNDLLIWAENILQGIYRDRMIGNFNGTWKSVSGRENE